MKDVNVFSYKPQTKHSWPQAYKDFLLSKDESMLLKIAPLLLILSTPEAVAALLIPVIGEIIDLGGLSMTLFVAYKTANAVQKYR